jgi:hypothetical protein
LAPPILQDEPYRTEHYAYEKNNRLNRRGDSVTGNRDRNTVSETFTVTNSAGVSRQVTFTGQRVNSIRNNIGADRVLGHFGGGLEYRFTPHIGIFAEAGYDILDGGGNNFIQTNFGLRYAF